MNISTDIIVSKLEEDGSEKIYFYFYDWNKGQFLNDQEKFDTSNLKISKGKKIKNLSAMDINNDGLIDLIITYFNEAGKINTEIYLGNESEIGGIVTFKLEYTLELSEFMIADINGDRL